MYAKAPSRGRYDDRQARRLTLSLPVWLVFGDRRETGHIINLSATGAKIFTHARPPLHQPVRLEWEDHAHACLCVWTRHRLCGVTFDVPLEDRTLAKMLY
jgi:PilZ domain